MILMLILIRNNFKLRRRVGKLRVLRVVISGVGERIHFDGLIRFREFNFIIWLGEFIVGCSRNGILLE